MVNALILARVRLRKRCPGVYHGLFVTVPLLDLHAQYTPLRQALLDAVTRVCDSQRFIGGPEVEGLERELCDTLGYPHAIGLSSGHRRGARGADGARHRPRRRSDHADLFVLRHGRLRRARRRQAGAGRLRARHVQHRHRRGDCRDHPAHQGDHPRAPVRPGGGHGAARRGRQPARHRGDRRRGAGHRLHVSRQAGRHDRRDRLLLVFPEQESRRVRRRGLRHGQRCGAGEEAAPDSHARHGAEVLPPPGRRQLPHRRDAGRGAARQAAASSPAGATAAAPTPPAIARCSPTPA